MMRDEESQNAPIDRGFTLFELLIVMAIIAIVGAVGIPMVTTSTNEAALSAAAAEVASALTYARRASMGTERMCIVSVDATVDTISVSHQHISPLAEIEDDYVFWSGFIDSLAYRTMTHPVRRSEFYRLNFKEDSRWNGVDVTGADFGGNSQVTFDYFGDPSSGGEISLERGGMTVTVSVDGITGRTSIEGGN